MEMLVDVDWTQSPHNLKKYYLGSLVTSQCVLETMGDNLTWVHDFTTALRLVQPCAHLYRRCRLVQLVWACTATYAACQCSLVQPCADLYSLVQPCTVLYSLVQTCTALYKLVQQPV